MSEQSMAALSASYNQVGWCRVKLPDVDCLRRIRDAIETRLRELCGNGRATLATYHDFVREEDHQAIQWELVQFFWSNDFCLEIGHCQIEFFRGFIGPDLHIQRRPYLRIARPTRRHDNIDIHRDTVYGQSPYEVAVHVPFLDLDADACLRFLPGSHVAPESAFTIVPLGDATWRKGSIKHEMGFPYAPKKIVGDLSSLAPVPIAFGEAVVFTPATVHGQDVNHGRVTRISVDFRVVSTFAPIKIRTDLSSRGYVPLCESAVAAVARRYHEACAAADQPKAESSET